MANKLITREGNEILVDSDIYELLKNKHVYERKDGVYINYKRINSNNYRLRVVHFILGNEDLRRRVFFKNNNRYDLRRENLIFTNLNFKLVNNYYECYLPNTTKFLIDIEDRKVVEEFPWGLKDSGYIFRKENHKYLYLHSLLMNCPYGLEVDHRNLNKLDNRKNNLRIATHQENMQNKSKSNLKISTSKYKGVSLKNDKAWYSRITMKDGTQVNLGLFNNEESAASCYMFYSNLLHGEFGRGDGILKDEWYKDRILNSSVDLKGVSIHGKSGLYRSRIIINGKEKSLGYFKDKISAYKTYNQNVVKYGLPFHKINILDSEDLRLLENYIASLIGIDMVENAK